jgi:hypothetical protein
LGGVNGKDPNNRYSWKFYKLSAVLIFLLSTALLLASCVSAPQQRDVPAVASSFASNLEAFRNRCVDYGFQPGTQQFAECVQKLDQENRIGEYKTKQDICVRLQNEINYWCSGEPAKRGMGNFGAINCGQKQTEFKQGCN